MSETSLLVAVGVIQDSYGRVLVALRSERQHQGGLWEFPGGKVEKGETVREALCRELYEEIGIKVEAAVPFKLLDYRYVDRRVLLDVWRVTRFTGEPAARESQPLEWRAVTDLNPDEFPAANRPIISELRNEESLDGQLDGQRVDAVGLATTKDLTDTE